MNKIILSGNLTRDPELRLTQNNKAYVRFSIAVNRPFSKDAVDFFNLVAWEKTAEFIDKWFSKGSRILVEGRLQTSKYKDKDGTERTATDVVVDNVEFAGGKRDDNRPTDKPAPTQSDSRNKMFEDAGIDPNDTPF